MMTSSNGNIFRVTGPLCGGFTGHRWILSHKGQWRGTLMFSLIFAWINTCVNNREASDLRRHRVHYDVIVMNWIPGSVASLSLSRDHTAVIIQWVHVASRPFNTSGYSCCGRQGGQCNWTWTRIRTLANESIDDMSIISKREGINPCLHPNSQIRTFPLDNKPYKKAQKQNWKRGIAWKESLLSKALGKRRNIC